MILHAGGGNGEILALWIMIGAYRGDPTRAPFSFYAWLYCAGMNVVPDVGGAE